MVFSKELNLFISISEKSYSLVQVYSFVNRVGKHYANRYFWRGGAVEVLNTKKRVIIYKRAPLHMKESLFIIGQKPFLTTYQGGGWGGGGTKQYMKKTK